MIKSLCKPWWNGLLDLLIPPHCAICGRLLDDGGATKICPPCMTKIQYLTLPQCLICGRELHGPANSIHRCATCLRQPPPYVRVASIIRYASPVTELLFRLKYHGDTTVVPAIAELVAGYDFSPFRKSDLILPVPLFRPRLQARGLNQSLVLARIFFPGLSDKIDPRLLRRLRWTAAQTGLTGAARRRNLRGAFGLDDPQRVAGKTVTLVDDVFTTGTTAAECSRTLLQGGCRAVSVVTFARVPPPD